jgi:hypothetical protein
MVQGFKRVGVAGADSADELFVSEIDAATLPMMQGRGQDH